MNRLLDLGCSQVSRGPFDRDGMSGVHVSFWTGGGAIRRSTWVSQPISFEAVKSASTKGAAA